MIHFMNMIIAIMGESQANTTAQFAVSTIKSHLQFVLDNEWLNVIKKDQINYLISAMIAEEEN